MFELDAVVLAAGGLAVGAGAGGLAWAKAVTITTDDNSPPSKRLERMMITPFAVHHAVRTRREEFLFRDPFSCATRHHGRYCCFRSSALGRCFGGVVLVPPE